MLNKRTCFRVQVTDIRFLRGLIPREILSAIPGVRRPVGRQTQVSEAALEAARGGGGSDGRIQ